MKVESDLCKPKHTVFVDSSDDDNEPSLKKLRYDSTKNYDDVNSNQKKGSSGKESSKVVSIVKKTRSDSTKKSDKKSTSHVDQNRRYSSEEVSLMKKTKSSKNEKIEKNSSTADKGKICRSVSNSDEDEEPPEKKSISDPTKDDEKNSKSKHIVFVDSSDDENEPSLKKLRYDSTKNYEKNSCHVVDGKRESSSQEDSQMETIVNKSRSDSTKNSNNNSSIAAKEKLSRSVSRPESLISSDGSIERSKKKSKFDHTNKSENNSVQKQGSSVEEVSLIDSIVTESMFDSTNNSSRPAYQNQELSTEDVSQIESEKKINPYEKRNETLLKCPMCKELSTNVVSTLRTHLKRKHSTTFGLCGIFLRCDCGHEAQSASDGHLLKCDIANYTLIRKRDGPIQTLHDKKVTPQCFLCEAYPRTATGYAHHLEKHHDSSLMASAKYLICSCGYEITSHNVDPSHRKKCDGRKFTMHNLGEE